MQTSKTNLPINQFQNEDSVLNSNNACINFINPHKQATEECIPLGPEKKQKVPWEYEIVEEKRECLKK